MLPLSALLVSDTDPDVFAPTHVETVLASRAAAELRPIVERVHPAGMAFLDPDVGPVGELRRRYTHEYGVVGKSGPSAVFQRARN